LESPVIKLDDSSNSPKLKSCSLIKSFIELVTVAGDSLRFIELYLGDENVFFNCSV
jgi:hypothetical protein